MVHRTTVHGLGAFKFKHWYESQRCDITRRLIKCKWGCCLTFIMTDYYSGAFQIAGCWLKMVIFFLYVFLYHYQRHLQEISWVSLVLQNGLNYVSLMWFSSQGISKSGFHSVFNIYEWWAYEGRGFSCFLFQEEGFYYIRRESTVLFLKFTYGATVHVDDQCIHRITWFCYPTMFLKTIFVFRQFPTLFYLLKIKVRLLDNQSTGIKSRFRQPDRHAWNLDLEAGRWGGRFAQWDWYNNNILASTMIELFGKLVEFWHLVLNVTEATLQ